jgi:hypothetical protein
VDEVEVSLRSMTATFRFKSVWIATNYKSVSPFQPSDKICPALRAGQKLHGYPMTISLEAQMIGTDLGWVPVPKSEVDLPPLDGPNGLTYWKGSLPYPPTKAATSCAW